MLLTNVANGRAFASPSSPAFEVLPSLASSVLQLLEAEPRRGVAVGELAAHARPQLRDDLLDLLEALLEHGVVVPATAARTDDTTHKTKHAKRQRVGTAHR